MNRGKTVDIGVRSFDKIRKRNTFYVDKTDAGLMIAFPVVIMLIYLGCVCFPDYGGIIYYIRPACIHGFMIFSAYLAWRSYGKEDSPAIMAILFSGIAVVLPFMEETYNCKELLFEFIWLLWPVLITCISNFGAHKLSKSSKLICSINIIVVLILAVCLHWFAEAGENVKGDLLIPVVWMAESVLWTAVLNFGNQHRKRNIMAAWLVCILIFGCFTFADISYLSQPGIWGTVRAGYWNQVIFLCWPLLLMFVIRRLSAHMTKGSPYFVWKLSLFYLLIVLSLIEATANQGLNYETGSMQYDIGRVFYLLLLADIMLWNDVYMKPEHAVGRIKALASMAAVNIGIFIFLLIKNERLREVLSYMGGFFSGSGTGLQADWIGYRRAAFHAFLSNDLTVLDSTYGKEHYLYSVYGYGLASIRFHAGLLPLLVMMLLLILLVVFLWKWNREDAFLNKCARYLAIAYILKMSIAFILQANMVISPYMEFPFTGTDMAEILLPILLVCEGRRRAVNGFYAPIT